MGGFTAIISKNRPLQTSIKFRNKNPFGIEYNMIIRRKETPKYAVEQYTNSHFSADKIFEDSEHFFIGIEGAIHNIEELKSTYNLSRSSEVVLHLYLQNRKTFPNLFRGDFSGFVYDKVKKEWTIFTNHTGSKSIFFFQNQDYFIFSSSLGGISYLLPTLGVKPTLNEDAAYLLLTAGSVMEELTLVNEVAHLMPGSVLHFAENSLKQHSYFHLKETSPNENGTRNDLKHEIDTRFGKAVDRAFTKDQEAGKRHFVTLSGGLDSRMTALVAHQRGFTAQTNFTLAQSNYLDETIAKKIASDYHHQFSFFSLDNGDYLKDIDRTVYYNDGLINYAGAAHLFSAIQQVNFSPFGLVHTGQVGDAVLGSFLSAPRPLPPKITDGLESTFLLDKVSPYLQQLVKKYPNEELYKFYTRGFRTALNGNFYFDIFSQTASPFLDPDFLQFCVAIPPEKKYKQYFYIDWLSSYYPSLNKYRWEKTGVSPSKSLTIGRYLSPHFYLRMSGKLATKLNKKQTSGMNPFDKWWAENPTLSESINRYFEQNISLLNNYQALQKSCRKLFTEGITKEKFMVITLLSAYKLHFVEAE